MDFRFMLESGDAEYPGCVLSLGLGKWTKRISLPEIIRPGVCKVRGQYNYDELIESRYGVYLFGTHFNLCYGRGDANFHRDIFGEEQRWSCFLPWEERRFMRFSLYNAKGEHYFSNWHTDSREVRKLQAAAEDEARNSVDKITFAFLDFDGEAIQATTHIEEREWWKGEGCFKWLSWFTAPKVCRSLGIEFSAETGKRKGSWKGGTVGHSIEMLPGELHEAAFRRYCSEHNMKFLSAYQSHI